MSQALRKKKGYLMELQMAMFIGSEAILSGWWCYNHLEKD